MYLYVKFEFKKNLNRIEHILVCYSIILANDTKVRGYLSDDVPPSEMKLTISLVDKWTRSHFTGTLLSNTDFCFLHDILGFCFSSRRLADNRTMTADDNYQIPQPARALVDGVKGPTSIDSSVYVLPKRLYTWLWWLVLKYHKQTQNLEEELIIIHT